MLTVVAKCKVQEDKIIDFKKAAAELVTAARQETGNITYELHQDNINSEIITFIERWEDEHSFKKHQTSSHFQTIVPLLNKFQTKKSEVNVYRQIN